jgi:hypothetical protein
MSHYFIISQLILHNWSIGLPGGSQIWKTGHNPHESSADWVGVKPANAAETNGSKCLLKHGGARDIKLLVTHPMTDLCERYLIFAIVC